MTDLSGKTIGQYQIIGPLTSGGMATIYTARQPALDRTVAIKVLPDYFIDQPGFLERFKIEAQAIARLDHPHILPVYDYGEYERTPYLVMKYVTGGTLKDLIAKGPNEPRQAGQLLRQMAEALEHAHQQGIIHRDVKPSNVLLQDGRWVLLMDFGLAKLLTGGSNLTASGAGVGTPDYMPPEQAQGLPADQRSDIYSLGIVLYQMLTGELPYRAETPMAVMLKQIVEPPSSPRLIRPEISPEVEAVVMQALSKAPEQRYQRALALADAYDLALNPGATLPVVSPGKPAIPTTQAATTSTPGRRGRRWPIVAGISAGVIALLAVLIAVIALTNRPAEPTSTGAVQGAAPLDDFSGAAIDETIWQYAGTYTATLNSPTVSIQNGRLVLQAANPTEEYYDGALYHQPDKPFNLVSARVTLQDATGYSDFGLQVNGIDGRPESWTYLAMTPSDGTVNVFIGNTISGTQQTYVLEAGSGMPATHELAIGWDGREIVFYVDGLVRKRLPSTELGREIHLLFDVEPLGTVSGSFDDVRLTYAP